MYVCMYGRHQAEHDERVRAVLHRLQKVGLTLNNQKCEFSKGRIKFLGHIVDAQGVHADPEKTKAIAQFPVPSNVTKLQRFMGMVNQLGKFIPGLADHNEPLRQLLRKENSWYWGEAQQKAFKRLKKILVSPEVLAHYEPSRPTAIAADASSTGIGAVLLQTQENGQRRPVCYISRSMSNAEKNYAVIEKEALASTWACERLEEYVLGLKFTLETDHKPLVPLFSTTDLSKMPPWILRFHLRLMRYSPEVLHVPGKCQITADALSRSPTSTPGVSDIHFIEEVENFASFTLHALPATTQCLQEIRMAQKADEECVQIRKYCLEGWPTYMPYQPLLRQYWENRAHLVVVDDLLLFDERIVIPRVLRLEMLDCIHSGHLGISKCRARARTSVWWPGLSTAIEDMVKRCTTCAKERPQTKEPLMPSSFPSRLWERLGMDLFEHEGRTYLIAVDYYSRWIEIKRLGKQTAESVITACKELFATHGIPDVIMSDNGPQFSAESFQSFASSYGFTHTTSSPKFPQANGVAERGVRSVKGLLKKNEDPYIALLTYRSTPLENGLSPSELLMGRRLRTQLPILPKNLQPRSLQREREEIAKKEERYRFNQQQTFNRRHRAHELGPLQSGDSVWIKDQDQQGKIQGRTQHPRSYLVKTEVGTSRRNQTALVPTDPPASSSAGLTPPPASDPGTSPVEPTGKAPLQTRSGRTVRAPVHLDL